MPLVAVLQAASTALTTGSSSTVTADQASNFLHSLQQRNQLRPACMAMAIIAQGGDLEVEEALADSVPVLQVNNFVHAADAHEPASKHARQFA
jgi:hypothetical protein